MRRSLFWKLLGINLLVVGIAVAVAALTIGGLADSIFTSLMKEFHIQVDVIHQLFSAALTRSLVLASLVAGGLGILLSVVLFRAVTSPARSMMTMASRIASGDYRARVRVRSADELGSLAISLNQMAESLATLETLRKDLVANVAHELRTPLTNLRGYLEAIREGVTTPSSATIASLHDEVMRLVRLVDALHELSLFDARLPRLQMQDVDLEAVARRLITLRQREFAAKQITLSIEMGPARPVQADPDLVAQAVANLLDNALKYTPAGGSVKVDAVWGDGEVQLTVANTGEGIAAPDLPFVFERFYRSEKSRARGWGGAGIGLSIVKEIAEAHGGRVGASSEAGLTRVWLTLPSGLPAGTGNREQDTANRRWHRRTEGSNA